MGIFQLLHCEIFEEKISAGARNRPEFQRMLDQIRDGDILVVWKLDRLARSTPDLLETMETIRAAGGKFQSLSEPWGSGPRQLRCQIHTPPPLRRRAENQRKAGLYGSTGTPSLR